MDKWQEVRWTSGGTRGSSWRQHHWKAAWPLAELAVAAAAAAAGASPACPQTPSETSSDGVVSDLSIEDEDEGSTSRVNKTPSTYRL